MKHMVKKVAAGVGAMALSGAALAQATLPAGIQDSIDDTLALAELIGWALVTVGVALLAFKYIRRVMR